MVLNPFDGKLNRALLWRRHVVIQLLWCLLKYLYRNVSKWCASVNVLATVELLYSSAPSVS